MPHASFKTYPFTLTESFFAAMQMRARGPTLGYVHNNCTLDVGSKKKEFSKFWVVL